MLPVALLRNRHNNRILLRSSSLESCLWKPGQKANGDARFISSQLQLEADAREALPYQFDTCTRPLGPLRQSLFSCLTCNPPPEDPSAPYTAAGVCYSCSISCHGEHELVELFSRRDFECDCGTKRLPSTSSCSLRVSAETGQKSGVRCEEPRKANAYNQNFRNRFCGCSELYNPHQQKGIMFQCLGLGTVEDGGCGEDWWHPECVLGISKDWRKQARSNGTLKTSAINGTESLQETADLENNNAERLPDTIEDGNPDEQEIDDEQLPRGFPAEEDFEHFVCYKCADAFPWIKRYAGTSGFLPAVQHQSDEAHKIETEQEKEWTAQAHGNLDVPSETGETQSSGSKKRKSHEAGMDNQTGLDNPDHKKIKEDASNGMDAQQQDTCRYRTLSEGVSSQVSLFLKDDFRDHLCRCPSCFPKLKPHPQLLEEEDTYEPPVSDGSSVGEGNGTTRSAGSRSLLDRGEAALSNMDRVRAIEGVMAYNHLRDKVKDFLKPFAESGQAVGAEDVKKYFEKLRGDEQAIREAGHTGADDGEGDGEGDNRRKQSGY